MRWLRPASLLAALLAFGAATEARAQSYSASQHQSILALRPSVSLSAGALQYDLAGTGSAPVLAARGELPLSQYFLVEGGQFAGHRPSNSSTFSHAGVAVGTIAGSRCDVRSPNASTIAG